MQKPKLSIACWLVCLICCWTASTTAQVQVCPGDTEGNAEQTVAIPILIDDPEGVDAFGFDLLYEAEVLVYDDVQPSALTAAWFVLEGSEVSPGVVMVGGFDLEPISVTTADTLCYVRMTVTNAGRESEYTLTNFEDDLAGAPDCSGLFELGQPVEADTWGGMKIRYRQR